MDTDSSMRFVYLAVLAAFIGGPFLYANRHRMGQMAQQAAIWFFIFIGFVVVYGFWNDIKGIAVPTQSYISGEEGMVISAPRQRDGHYHLTLGINGVDVSFIVDTGATDLVLTRQDAVAVGLNPDDLRFFGRAMTANGTVETASVRLDQVTLGDIADRDVPAVVNGGEMSQSLLGMSYLQTFGRIEIENNELRLVR